MDDDDDDDDDAADFVHFVDSVDSVDSMDSMDSVHSFSFVLLSWAHGPMGPWAHTRRVPGKATLIIYVGWGHGNLNPPPHGPLACSPVLLLAFQGTP